MYTNCRLLEKVEDKWLSREDPLLFNVKPSVSVPHKLLFTIVDVTNVSSNDGSDTAMDVIDLRLLGLYAIYKATATHLTNEHRVFAAGYPIVMFGDMAWGVLALNYPAV